MPRQVVAPQPQGPARSVSVLFGIGDPEARPRRTSSAAWRRPAGRGVSPSRLVHAIDLREPLLTAAEAAAMLSVRPSWIAAAARSGHLPCVRIGKHVRRLSSDLERWVAEQRS